MAWFDAADLYYGDAHPVVSQGDIVLTASGVLIGPSAISPARTRSAGRLATAFRRFSPSTRPEAGCALALSWIVATNLHSKAPLPPRRPPTRRGSRDLFALSAGERG